MIGKIEQPEIQPTVAVGAVGYTGGVRAKIRFVNLQGKLRGHAKNSSTPNVLHQFLQGNAAVSCPSLLGLLKMPEVYQQGSKGLNDMSSCFLVRVQNT